MTFSLKDRTVQIALKIIAGILFIIVVVIAGNRMAFEPMKKSKKQMNAAQTELSDIQKLAGSFPNPKKSIEEIREKMDALQKRAISDKELPRVIQIITKKCNELLVEVDSIKPTKELIIKELSLPQGVSKSYIELIARCEYKNLGEFLKALEDLPVIFTVEGVSIAKLNEEDDPAKKKKEEVGKVIATIIMSSYSILR